MQLMQLTHTQGVDIWTITSLLRLYYISIYLHYIFSTLYSWSLDGWNSASVMPENFFRTRFSNPQHQPSYESGAGCWYWPMAVGSSVNCSMRAMDVRYDRSRDTEGRSKGRHRDGDRDRKNRRYVKIFEVQNYKSYSVDRSNMAQPCCPCSEFPCPRRGTIVDVVLRQTATPSQAHSDGFQAIRIASSYLWCTW